MPLQQYDTIKLRDEFEGTLGDHDAIDRHPNRTPGKDEVAEHIKTEVVAKGRWPIQMTQLAEETGYSRQHVANVIQDYFRGVEDDGMSEGGSATDHSSPMSASPSQPAASGTQTGSGGATETAGTKSVFVEINGHMQEIEIDIPEGVNRSDYVRGYLDAMKD